MPHARKLLRDAVVAALVDPVSPGVYKTAAGTRVFESRMAPVRAAELPCISVYTTDEEVDPTPTSPRELTRTTSLEITAWADATDDLDDVLDAFALQIEDVVEADPHFGDTAFRTWMTGTSIGLLEEGRTKIGALTISYAVTYHTRYEAPDSDLDDLSTVDTVYNLGGEQHEDDQANDQITDLEE